MNFKLVAACLFVGSLSFAQEKADDRSNANYVGIQMGSLGAGAQYVHSIHPRWNLRFSGSYFKASMDQTIETTDYTEYRTNNGQVGAFAALADFNISKNTPNWKLSTGLMYQVNKINRFSSFEATINDDVFDMGTLDLTFTAFPVNPYAGLVFGNFKTEKKVFITLELGTLFHGKPNVDFEGTGMIRLTGQDNEQRVNDNVSNYNWFPYANFQINYKLN